VIVHRLISKGSLASKQKVFSPEQRHYDTRRERSLRKHRCAMAKAEPYLEGLSREPGMSRSPRRGSRRGCRLCTGSSTGRRWNMLLLMTCKRNKILVLIVWEMLREGFRRDNGTFLSKSGNSVRLLPRSAEASHAF
jgi:hypothetical protein